MEILRKTAKNGTVYRIYKIVPAWNMFVIEYMKIHNFRDGTECQVWYPAYKPNNKVFADETECLNAFDNFLKQ